MRASEAKTASALRMPFTSDPDDLTKLFLVHLTRNEPQRAAATLRRLVSESNLLDGRAFRPLFRSAERHVDVFLDALLADEQTTFSCLSLAAKALELGRRVGRLPAVRARIAALAAAGTLPAARFGGTEFLWSYMAAHARVIRDVARLKYSGLTLPIRLEETVPLATQLSPNLSLPATLRDRLYQNTRFTGFGREEWEKRLRTAFCVDHITTDSPLLHFHFAGENSSGRDGGSLDALIDLDAAEAFFSQFKSSQGILFVFVHGGFTRIVISAFRRIKRDDGVVVRRRAPGPNLIATSSDSRTALFQVMRAIQDGKSVLVAPDAQIGTMGSSMRILGSEVPMADGTPFVAYESGCETVWISMQCTGKRFRPNLVPGPARGDGEGFKSFKRRWLDFYAEQLEELLTGDPINLSLTPGRWTQFLERAG
jgi:hypothetical protein